MKKYEEKFTNELGNEILVHVSEKETHGAPGVSIFIEGPTSDTENHVTLLEAEAIYKCLGLLIEEMKKSEFRICKK